MPLTINSPKHSFVNFEGKLTDFVIPAYNSIAIAFQFMLPVDNGLDLDQTLTTGVFYDEIIHYTHASFEVTNLCAWGRITGFDLDNPANYPVTISVSSFDGIYNTKEDLLEAIRTNLDFNCYSADFLQCCDLDTITNETFSYDTALSVVGFGGINFYKGLQQVTLTENANTLFSAAGISLNECFKYYIGHGSDKTYSNQFKRVSALKYLTAVTYSNNEDAYGFYYPFDTVFNKILLPLYVRHPKYPEKRSVYLKSNKQYKVLSANIEKEFELITEYMPESMHEKIAVMLAHDNLHFTSDAIDSDVYKKDDYDIDWQERVEYAQAKCKVNTPFEGRNSNCEQRITC